METINTEQKGHVFYIGLNRPKQRNAFNMQMLQELAQAYSDYEASSARCALLFAHGKHFTLGLELDDVSGALQEGKSLWPSDKIDPTGLTVDSKLHRTKPVVTAIHGMCFTIGIELILATDISIATQSSKFTQMEVKRGILPFCGATMRFVDRCGWGNAMRYILTGDEFSASEALRIGLVQEVVGKDELFSRAEELATQVAEQAPLAVQAALASSRRFSLEGERAAAEGLMPVTLELMQSEDAQEGVNSFLEKRAAQFQGK